MTKSFCISRRTFNKYFGYGFWGIITFGLLSLLILNSVEINSTFVEQRSKYYSPSLSEYKEPYTCYKTILTDEKYCNRGSEVELAPMVFFGIGNSINFIVMGFWIYYKQKYFRFEWCENKEARERKIRLQLEMEEKRKNWHKSEYDENEKTI